MARPAARAPKPSHPLERAVRSETVKHYAETIFYIRQEEGRVRPGRLAEWLGVSAPTVTVTLQRLARDGFVEIGTDRSVTLTPRGEDLAAKIVRVHRLLERWLTDVLGLDWAAADEEAQRLASGVSELVADRLDETLGYPATCPHGNVVPGREPPYGSSSRCRTCSGGAGTRAPHLGGRRARRPRPAPRARRVRAGDRRPDRGERGGRERAGDPGRRRRRDQTDRHERRSAHLGRAREEGNDREVAAAAVRPLTVYEAPGVAALVPDRLTLEASSSVPSGWSAW